MKKDSNIIEDSKFIFEPVQIDKPSDLKDFIERYRRLDEKYNNLMNDYSVSFNDGNLHHICNGDFEMLIEDNSDNSYLKIGLSDIETIVLRSFTMRSSGLYRLDEYNCPIPPIVISLCEILDNALNKLPRFKGDLLIRACDEVDPANFQTGEMFIPNYALTTSANKNWGDGENVIYIVTPLMEGSRACALYYVDDGPEKQVTFLRGTPFLVKDIKCPETKKIEIYLEEVNK